MTQPGKNIVRSLPVYEGPEDVRLQMWLAVVRAYNVVLRRVTATLAQQELTLPQFDVLATLYLGEGVSQQELADRLLVTKGNVCGLLDRLEKLGWVERRADAQDRRTNRLYLTANGRRKLNAVMPRYQATVLSATSAIPVPDAKVFRRLAQLLAQANEGET